MKCKKVHFTTNQLHYPESQICFIVDSLTRLLLWTGLIVATKP